MKKALYLAGCLLVVITTTACGNPKLKNGEEVVAEINGKKYTADELYKELKNQYGYETIIGWVDESIANSEVKDSKEIDSYVNEAISFYKQYADAYGMTLPQFAANTLGISGITSEEDLKKFIKKDRKLTLAVQNYVAAKLPEKEIKKFYDDNYKTTYNYRVIFMKENDDTEKTVDTILKELKNTKSDKLDSKFAELAREYSEDSSAQDGGLYENATKVMVEEKVWNNLSKLSDKKYSKSAITTDNGVYIIYRQGKGKTPEYKDVKEDIKSLIAQEKLSEDQTLQYDALNELRNKYKLSFKDKDLKEAYDAYMKDIEDYKKQLAEQAKEEEKEKEK